MALVIEDGTGKADAESYISVAGADTRLAALGLTNWATLSSTEKEEALRRATAYMEQAYSQRWSGTRMTRDQALSWPRYGAIANGWDVLTTVVPVPVANTCADIAFKAAAGDLNADLTRAIIREKVGPLETEYSAHGAEHTRYRSIDMALAPYLQGAGMNARLVRA